MKTYIILGILIVLFIYLVIWTLKLYALGRRQKRVERVRELRAKKDNMKNLPSTSKEHYWYNLRDMEDCSENESPERYYHYFGSVDEGMLSLLLEMYDCGIVRTDELEKLAYGKSSYEDVDLSFLEEFEKEDNSFIEKLEDGLPDFFKPKKEAVVDDSEKDDTEDSKKDDVVDAAKGLKKDDPGILDINGTLSEGVEKIIEAVDDEKKKEAKKEEPILLKKEKSIEKARKSRELTANAETRKKIYEKWEGYVSDLYETVKIHADEETCTKIKKDLMEYGYNDIDILLESPEYNIQF